jgi:uncharacterized protein involved in type VI secretion and phage assembly
MKIYIECGELGPYMGVVHAHIDEGANQVTMIDLELASRETLSTSDMDNLIGKPITLFVEDLIDNQLQKVRWDGHIFEMIDVMNGLGHSDVYYYAMIVRPRLWLLNFTSNCRSFPNKSRPQVIDELLKAHGFSDGTHYKKSYFKESLYPTFDQLLQTGNTDLSFFKRLLANAGINYYFAAKESGDSPEMLQLIDSSALFPSVSGEIPVVGAEGMIEDARRIETISRLNRAVPGKVKATAFLADGSTYPKTQSAKVDTAGTEGVIRLFTPEGLKDAEKTAKLVATIASEGFSASRVEHRGVADHVRVKPGNRITVKNLYNDASYQILVTHAQHRFTQSVAAALSDTGSGNPAYTNTFRAVEHLAPIRPTDSWIDVDDIMDVDSALGVHPDGQVIRRTKFTHVTQTTFNPDADPIQNAEAIKELLSAVTMQQQQIKALKNRIADLEAAVSAGGAGIIAGEITKDAWMTDGYELVCMVKTEEFEEPVVVKTAVPWHDKGGGVLNLPRAGNHVWIERVHRSRGNEWVLLGYRPTATVSASNNPAKQLKVKKLS